MSYPVLTNLDLNGNQLLNAVLQQLASDPATPFEGQFWQNTTSDEVKAYLNGAIVIIQSGPITSADIQDGTITDSDVAGANKDGAVGTPSLRTIGTGAQQAMAGSTRLDTIASPTGPVSLNTQKITGLLAGTADTDGVNVGQLNSIVAGLDYKASVRAATTTAGTLASSFANASVIDGIALATNDRILIKNQAVSSENGIYIVNAAGAPTRALDFDSWLEIPGAVVAVELGTVNADSVYLATADQGGTIDSTAITFSKLGPSAGGAGTVTKFAGDITGNAAATQFTVTHNLNTTDVSISVYDVTNDLEIIVDKKRPTANTCRLDFAQAPASGKIYRCVVLG